MAFWGQWQVGVLGAGTKAKIILPLLGSLPDLNCGPLALVLYPVPCEEG